LEVFEASPLASVFSELFHWFGKRLPAAPQVAASNRTVAAALLGWRRCSILRHQTIILAVTMPACAA
jgi:hypothetical protein